jgi:Transglutaminase-like superfamily
MISAVRASSPAPDGMGYTLAADTVLLLIQDGTARLLDFRGHFYALSETAAVMLDEILRSGPAAAAMRIAAVFDVRVAQARCDVDTLLADLISWGVVREPRSRAPRAVTGGRSARLLAASTNRVLAFLGPEPPKVASPLLAAAYASVRLFGWSLTTATWKQSFSVTATPSGTASEIDTAVRAAAAQHVLSITCKERALACWALLRTAGWPAELVLGVDLYPLASHVWCECEGTILSDYEDRCRRFTPVQRYT